MPTFTKTRRMTAQAGVQTFNHSMSRTVTAVTVNGSAATITDANGLVTITSPTLAGGEAIVATETEAPPSIPAPTPLVISSTVSVALVRTQNGAQTTQTLAGVSDEKGSNAEFGVTLTKANH